MKKAMIAMSGGVDSSVAAWLMKRDGYDCMGVTMRLFAGEDSCERKGHTCCSLDDVEDARSVARQLGIPYFVFNFTEDFGTQIMDRFVCAYENGFTPNPCIDCNRYMKFEKLMKRAKELDYDYVVTGHYARIEEQDGKFLLKKAIDEKKDQSYVLYSLTQEQLAHTLFPLGGMTKPQIREMAEEQGLINARKHDSQDICFVPAVLSAAIPGSAPKKRCRRGCKKLLCSPRPDRHPGSRSPPSSDRRCHFASLQNFFLQNCRNSFLPAPVQGSALLLETESAPFPVSCVCSSPILWKRFPKRG